MADIRFYNMELLNLENLPPKLQNTATNYTFAAGQRLFRQGDRAKSLYLVTSGRIKLVRYTIEGRMVVLQVARRGESLGENALVSNVYSCTAIAEIESNAIVYPQSLLSETSREYPELTEHLISRLVTKIQSFEINLELLQIRSAHLRLFQYLRYDAISNDRNTVNLNQPLQEVAAELNLSPRTISRALARLESEGRIIRQADSIILQI